MYNNKKLGGILIESKLNNNSYIFNVGIGLNVNENYFDFPKGIQNSSISLKEIKKHPIQREPLLASILNTLDMHIDNRDDNLLIKDWMSSCNHINKNVKFKYQDHLISGIFKLINNKGQAVISHNKKYLEYDGAISIL